MATKSLLLFATCILFVFVPSHSQVHMCIDAVVKVKNDGVFTQNGVYYESLKWTNGTTLRVKFIGGDETIRNKIIYYAKQWENYANVHFNIVQYGDADIRIAFVPNIGSHSRIGTAATQIPQNESTMNFGWFTPSTPESEVKRTTLHEFGHALGLLHEHQNPLNPIKWNREKAYGYYMQAQGWTREMVDLNIFNRYSVTQTNNKFDRQSIMIYAIPKELTEDGYGVDWTYDLSEGDKKLIGELYPKYVFKPVINGGSAKATIQKIDVEHNIFRDGKKGMLIKTNFQVENALNKPCKLVGYFYNNDGVALRANNTNYSTTTGNVAAWVDFTPMYPNTLFTAKEIFIPYDALNVANGEFKLKFSLSIWEGGNEIAQGGAYYFSYQSGPVCDNMDVIYRFDDINQRLVINPKFTIKHAQNLSCNAVVYFYFDDGSPMKAIATANSTSAGNLAFWAKFQPGYEITNYNYGYLSDLTFYVPYSEFRLARGFHKLKFFVSLESASWAQMTKCVSNWVNFTMTIP